VNVENTEEESYDRHSIKARGKLDRFRREWTISRSTTIIFDVLNQYYRAQISITGLKSADTEFDDTSI